MSNIHHLLAYKSGTNVRHLCRVNTSSAKHFGAGGIVCDLEKDAAKRFNWGEPFTVGSSSVKKPGGYVAASPRDGSGSDEVSVANSLFNAVKAGTSSLMDNNDWMSIDNVQPCFYYMSGGMGFTGKCDKHQVQFHPDFAESFMSISAYHFTLPEAYRNAGLTVDEAWVRYKGIGNWVQAYNGGSYTGTALFKDMKTWESDHKCGIYTSGFTARRYPDSQSLGVHLIHGATLNKTVFSPAKCFMVYNSTGATSYELRNLYQSVYNRKGANPTDAQLKSWFGIDMTDDRNKHWKTYHWTGSRSYTSSSAERFKLHTWAMSNGGSKSMTGGLFTTSGGATWFNVPNIPNASYYPSDDSDTFYHQISLTDEDKTALNSVNGVWVICHQLPMLKYQSYTGGSYLPTSAVTWEHGPWVGGTNTSASKEYRGMAMLTLDKFSLRVVMK